MYPGIPAEWAQTRSSPGGRALLCGVSKTPGCGRGERRRQNIHRVVATAQRPQNNLGNLAVTRREIPGPVAALPFSTEQRETKPVQPQSESPSEWSRFFLTNHEAKMEIIRWRGRQSGAVGETHLNVPRSMVRMGGETREKQWSFKSSVGRRAPLDLLLGGPVLGYCYRVLECESTLSIQTVSVATHIYALPFISPLPPISFRHLVETE